MWVPHGEYFSSKVTCELLGGQDENENQIIVSRIIISEWRVAKEQDQQLQLLGLVLDSNTGRVYGRATRPAVMSAIDEFNFVVTKWRIAPRVNVFGQSTELTDLVMVLQGTLRSHPILPRALILYAHDSD